MKCSVSRLTSRPLIAPLATQYRTLAHLPADSALPTLAHLLPDGSLPTFIFKHLVQLRMFVDRDYLEIHDT